MSKGATSHVPFLTHDNPPVRVNLHAIGGVRRPRRARRETPEAAALLEQLGAGRISAADAVALVGLGGSSPDLVAALAASPKGVLIAETVELERRRQRLVRLREVVGNAGSSERDDVHS